MSESLRWIDVLGNVYDLSDTNQYYAVGPMPPVGEYGLPVTVISHNVPLQPGVVEQWIQVAANDVRFPLNIFGSNQASVDANRRMLSEAMRPTRGVGILEHTANDGTVRQLNCRETSRFRDVTERGPGYTQFGLIFSAADPFWYDVNWTALAFAPGGTTTFFQTPFFPLHLSLGGLSSNFAIYNNGQAEAWPIWTITGPASNITLTNNTTGETLTSTISLSVGQVLTIDTRPGVINVLREDGSDQWGTIVDTSQIWALIVGNNSISVNMSSTTTASQVQIQYKQRYEGV